jgi:hypothetical protein
VEARVRRQVEAEYDVSKTKLEATRLEAHIGNMNAIRNGVLFGTGLVALGGMAYLFRSSTLASIPLIAIAALVVFWSPFQKFSQLHRVVAEFKPSGVHVDASSQVDKTAELMSELHRRKIELEITAVEKNIELLEAEKKAKASESKDEPQIHILSAGS